MKRIVDNLDKFQQTHDKLAFVLAVVKKYGDDDAGHQAALLTYYGFLSLFPLLLVATSLVDLVANHNAHLRERLLNDTTSYFPVIGHQLSQNIGTSNKSGLALAVGVLFALYGARGIADATRGALDTAWGTPRKRRAGFPSGLIKSIGLLFGAGFGLFITTVFASYATSTLGHTFILRLVPIVINAALLYFIFMYIFLVGPSRRRRNSDLRMGAVTMVISLLILQTIGGYLITHQLHRTSGIYGQFAVVLVLLFWLYLLAQVFMYSIEVNVVHTHRLWPRSLTGDDPTPADTKATHLHDT